MKFILLLLALALGAYAYWSLVYIHPHAAACRHFATLCGDGSRSHCDDTFDGLAQTLPAEELKKSAECLAKAETCPQAAGCLAGGAGKAGLKAASEFFKGLGESRK